MRPEIRFRNKAAGLAINGVQRPRGECGVQWDCHGLPFARRQRSSHFAMTAARGDDLEPELNQSRRNGAA